MSQAWDEQNIYVPERIRTYDLLNTGRALYPLSYGELMESEAIGSYLTGVMHTARISNVDVAMCGERMKDGKF